MQRVIGQAQAPDARARGGQFMPLGRHHSWLWEQNACLQRGLQDLVRERSALELEIRLQRNGIFPEPQKQIERLQQENARLAAFTNDLYQRYRQETTSYWMNNPVPQFIQNCTEEPGMNSFSQQRARERRGPARGLLAQNQQNEGSPKVAKKLQAQLATGGESSCVSTLREGCSELEKQLMEMTHKNARLAEENSYLREQMCWAYLVQAENADLKEELLQMAKKQFCDIQALSHLQTQVEDLKCRLQVLTDMEESTPGEVKREHGEARQLFQAQVDGDGGPVAELVDGKRGFILSDLLKMVQMMSWKTRAAVILVTFLCPYLCWMKRKRT